MAKKQDDETSQVYWRLPEALVADCEEQDSGGNWAEGYRSFLTKAAKRGDQLVVEGPPVSKSMSLPTDVERYLEDEALRLTKATGQEWSAMQVGRELWRQSRLPRLTREANRAG